MCYNGPWVLSGIQGLVFYGGNTMEDAQYACCYVSSEELEYLRDLLRYEIMVRLTYGSKEENIEEAQRIYGFMAEFDFYRHHDDVLKELLKVLSQSGSRTEAIVVLKKYADLYEFLLTTTIGGGVPEFLMEATERLSQDLLDRVKKALAGLYTLEELSRLQTPQPSDLGINIFGNKAAC
jgi:hypothetical protein